MMGDEVWEVHEVQTRWGTRYEVCKGAVVVSNSESGAPWRFRNKRSAIKCAEKNQRDDDLRHRELSTPKIVYRARRGS